MYYLNIFGLSYKLVIILAYCHVNRTNIQNFQNIADMSVKSITSTTALLANANTTPSKLLNGPGNRGTIAQYFKQGRSSAVASLDSQFEGTNDRPPGIINVNRPASASLSMTDSEVTYDIKDSYGGIPRYLKPKLRELGQFINNDVADILRTKTWRFYGDPATPISTYFDLMSATTKLRLYGSTSGMAKAFIPSSIVPTIVQAGMADFTMKRGDKDAYNWELSNSNDTDFYRCDFLPEQIAGTVGQTGTVLTVVSTVVDANGGVIQILFSGAAASDPDAIRAGDKFQFNDSVAGQPNLRLVQFVGHGAIPHFVQNCALTNAASDGAGNVLVTLVEPLQAASGQLQNINNQIVAGMQVKFLHSHVVGMIMQGDPLMLAFAPLEKKEPFMSASVTDPDTQVSLRLTYASEPFNSVFGWSYNALYGMDLDADNAIALIFPSVSAAL